MDNQLYFLTAHTYHNRYQLKESFQKQKLLSKFQEFLNEYSFTLYAWVILINHYHILFKTLEGNKLAKIIGKIHTGYSYEINQLENKRGRKIWQNYWDRCIRSEEDFWIHLN